MLSGQVGEDSEFPDFVPLTKHGKRIRAIPETWENSFGSEYYTHQRNFPPVEQQNEQDWKLRIEGQLFEVGRRLNVTGFDKLKQYIEQELTVSPIKEDLNG